MRGFALTSFAVVIYYLKKYYQILSKGVVISKEWRNEDERWLGKNSLNETRKGGDW